MTLIPVRPGRSPLYLKGPFSAELAPSLPARQTRSFSERLYIGLLLSGPDADGHGAVELLDDEYSRQPIDLVPRSTYHLAIPRPVLFDLCRRPLVQGLGLFREDGDLEAYGTIRSAWYGPQPPSRFEFQSHQILIKRPDR